MNPTDELIADTLRRVKTIAIVGASNKPHRASHGVMRFLQGRGYRCIPVNPTLVGQTLDGARQPRAASHPSTRPPANGAAVVSTP